MEQDKIEALEKFILERLPEPERDRVIMVIDDKPITWRKMIEELKKGGDFAKKIEVAFEEMVK